MKTLIVSAMVVGLTASASLADEPMKLTSKQMDNVKAGQLIDLGGGLIEVGNIIVRDVVDVENVRVNVNAVVAALGTAVGGIVRPR